MTVFIAFISIFAVVKLFPLSLEMLKPPATYGIFALIRFVKFTFLDTQVFVSAHMSLHYSHNTFFHLRILFTVFVLLSVLMAVFTILCVPETRGRSLAEIQSMYGEVGFCIFLLPPYH